MLTITLEKEKDTVIPYCHACKHVYSPGIYAYIARDGSHELASGLFEIQSDQVQVICYCTTQPEDPHLMDGILRAGLNYASDQGMEKGTIPLPIQQQYEGLFQQLNYPIQPTFSIENLFSKYKNCP